MEALLESIDMTMTGVFIGALQEYQDHPSDEEDGDLYDKIGCTDAARDDRFGSGPDKRRCRLNSWRHQRRPSWSGERSVYKCLKLFSQ